MPNEITIPKNLGKLPAAFAGKPIPNDLAAGITGGFGVVSIRGKAWHIKYRGEEQTLMRPDGDGAVSFIDAVIVRAAPHLSKIFYKNGYVEGATDRPDCWSPDSIRPDPTVPDMQSPTCGTCPQNVWGSKITPAGKPSRACADSKRLAVVPLHDIDNEAYGGPMLLRIPPASLADTANYAQKLGALGYPYYAVATRIQFDVQSEYPRLIFTSSRVLTDEEAEKIAALQDDPRVGRILAENGDFVASHDANPPAEAAAPAPKPAAPTPAPAPKPAPVTATVAAKPVSGFGAAKSTPAQAPAPEDSPGEIPEGLKRTAEVTQLKPKKAKAKANSEAMPDDAPVTDFDAALDNLLST